MVWKVQTEPMVLMVVDDFQHSRRLVELVISVVAALAVLSASPHSTPHSAQADEPIESRNYLSSWYPPSKKGLSPDIGITGNKLSFNQHW